MKQMIGESKKTAAQLLHLCKGSI